LQKALAAYLAEAVCATIADAVRASRAGLGSPREVVDLTFDAFDREGAGALASWMLLSGNEDALDPIVETIHDLVDELRPEEADHEGDRPIHRITLSLVLLALGDALLGGQLTNSLQLPRSAARETAEEMLVRSMAQVSAG
jgi:hypothetical protein